MMCLARRERNLQGWVTEPFSFLFTYVLGDKENPPNWQTPFTLDYGKIRGHVQMISKVKGESQLAKR